MKENLIQLMVDRLTTAQASLTTQFNAKHPVSVARFFYLDNFLPDHIAQAIASQFPSPKKMHLLNSGGELKLKFSRIKETSDLIQAVHHAVQDPRVITCIENITGIQHQLPDHSRLAGGVSSLLKGYYINPHLDTSHDVDKQHYRVLNMLYYVSPDWKLENGGNYELWDERVENKLTIPCHFNRLLVMETNQTSWHAVSPVLVKEPRRCIFNYYFSEHSPTGKPYFHAAKTLALYNPLFKPRPEQTVRRWFSKLRNQLFK